MDVFKMTNFTRLIHIVSQEDEANGADGKTEFYPLRPIQRWLIDTHLQKARSTMMNVGALVRLDPSIDMERLAAALNDLIHSYDIFRCRLAFDPETGEICQRFDGNLARVYVESLSDEAFERRKQEIKEPFEIINRPLYRSYLMKTSSAQYLYIDFYHAIMDGMAIAMLFWRELEKRYKALGSKSVIARKPAVSYAEYILAESRADQEELAKGHAYWRKMLADFDEKKHLPPIDVHDGKNWESNEFETPIESTVTPDYFRGRDYTENTFFLGAAMLALARISGVRESLMSWVHNGRTTMHERRLMGLMLNQLPIRWDFAEGQTVGEFLRGLEAKINEGLQYSKSLDVVYDEGLEDLCASFILQKGAIGRRGTLNFMGTEAVLEEMPDNDISAAENTLDIELNVHPDGTYSLVLDYDASWYSEASMHRFAQTVDEMIAALMDEDRPVMDLIVKQ